MTETTAALLIRPAGEVVDVDLPSRDGDVLNFMYAELDCDSVDVVPLTTRLWMWVDDTGAYTKPVNRAATSLAGRYGLEHQDYHGAALVTAVDDDGGAIGMSTDQLSVVRDLLAENEAG